MLSLWRREQPPWDASRMPSQQGKIVVVTGANSGTGFEAAKQLAELGATVVLACRSETRGQDAVARIAEHLQHVRDEKQQQSQSELMAWQTTGTVELMQVDMGELASIARFAARFQERFDRLDLLINNAGVAMPAHRHTADGLETQLGVNHIGAFELTRLLFSALSRSSDARVVAVSSIAHRKADMNFASQAQGESKRAWADFVGYANSKMANLLFTYELDRRLKKAAAGSKPPSIRAVAAHPGMTHTAIFARFVEDFLPRALHWLLLPLLFALPFNSVEVGTLPILYVATVESVEGGEYYGPDRFGGRVGYPSREISSPESYSEEVAANLWTLSEELVGNRFDVR